MPSLASLYLDIINITNMSVTIKFRTWYTGMKGDVPPSYYLSQYKLPEETQWFDGDKMVHDSRSTVTVIIHMNLQPNTTYIFRVIPIYFDHGVEHDGSATVASKEITTKAGIHYHYH